MKVYKPSVSGILLLILTMTATVRATSPAIQQNTVIPARSEISRRVSYPFVVVSTKIKPDTIYRRQSDLKPDELKLIQKGSEGQVIKVYLLSSNPLQSGNPMVFMETIPAKPTVYAVGARMVMPLASRGAYFRTKTYDMEATAYDPSAGRGRYATGRTAIGMKAGYGIVAVDPRVIPLRTELYIEGYGFAIAGDTGGSIKGKRIDLGLNTRKDALKFGRKKVRVHVLK